MSNDNTSKKGLFHFITQYQVELLITVCIAAVTLSGEIIKTEFEQLDDEVGRLTDWIRMHVLISSS